MTRLSFFRGFLLSAGISAGFVGCAAVDAIVSPQAVKNSSNSSPERLLAIGRVFESQGHLVNAQAMYSLALKYDPDNTVVRDRLEFIASLGPANDRNQTERSSKDAIAIADSLQTRNRLHVQSVGRSVDRHASDWNSPPREALPSEVERTKQQSWLVEPVKPTDETGRDTDWLRVVDTKTITLPQRIQL